MDSFSITTVAASALVSILTGYVGALLSLWRQRAQDRRTFGLALLAEIKTIQRGLSRYRDRLERAVEDGTMSSAERAHLQETLRFWRHDLSIYTGNAGKIGLFSPIVAVELIEFYLRVRWLDMRAAVAPIGPEQGERLDAWIADHLKVITEARRHSRFVARLLHREIPTAWTDIVRSARRRHFGRRSTQALGGPPRRACLTPTRSCRGVWTSRHTPRG